MRLLGRTPVPPAEVGEARRGPQFLHRSIAQQFAVQILKGELPESYVFPSENEFSVELGVSRSALREAFRMLSVKGLVQGRPRAGTRVSPRKAWSLLDPELMAWHFEAEPSESFMRHLLELRHRALYDAIVAGNAPRAERTMIELIRREANDAAILLDEKPTP